MNVTAFFVVLGVIVLIVGAGLRALASPGGRRSSGPGPGASGAVYDMLNEDKRKAIEIILEQRAEATDPETADEKPESGYP
jgi:hypothetical protein